MKNKDEIRTETCFRRFQLLTKLQRHTYWLITSTKPVKEKLAIWHKDFEKFCKELARQDTILRNS